MFLYIKGDVMETLKASYAMGELPCVLCGEPTMGRMVDIGPFGPSEVAIIFALCPKHPIPEEILSAIQDRQTKHMN